MFAGKSATLLMLPCAVGASPLFTVWFCPVGVYRSALFAGRTVSDNLTTGAAASAATPAPLCV